MRLGYGAWESPSWTPKFCSHQDWLPWQNTAVKWRLSSGFLQAFWQTASLCSSCGNTWVHFSLSACVDAKQELCSFPECTVPGLFPLLSPTIFFFPLVHLFTLSFALASVLHVSGDEHTRQPRLYKGCLLEFVQFCCDLRLWFSFLFSILPCRHTWSSSPPVKLSRHCSKCWRSTSCEWTTTLSMSR